MKFNFKITKRDLGLIVINAVLSSLLSLLIFNLLSPPKVVQFNLKSLVDLVSSQYAKAGLTPQQQAQQSQEFASALSQATKQYAKQNDAVIIVSPAVVSGAYDATQDISNLTHNIMEGQK